MSWVGSMVAPQSIILVICLLFQKYWTFYQFRVMGRFYGSSSEHYLGNMFIISEILVVLSVLCHGKDLWQLLRALSWQYVYYFRNIGGWFISYVS